jgi:hypothetical protein
MKKIIVIGCMMFLGGIAKAEVPGVIGTSVTVNTVNISSFVATNAIPASIAMADRTFVILQNLDSSNNILCSDKVITSTTTNVFMVQKSGVPYVLNIRPYSGRLASAITIYCLTEKTTGPSPLSIVQAY